MVHQARISLRRRSATSENRTGWLFVLPQVIGLVVFLGIPLLVSIYYTFTKWDLIAPGPTWVGLANWEYLLHDPRVPKVLGNTVRFILFGTLSYLVLALVVALMLRAAKRGAKVYRAVFIFPYILSAVAVGAMWRWVLDSRAGPIAEALGLFGIQSPDWLFQPEWAMIAIALTTTWQALGFGAAIYLAGLQDIPPELYEAAKVDGATAWQRFRYVTLPQLSPVLLFLMVTAVIGALQLYDPVVAMTGDGFGNSAAAGGPQDSTRTLVLYMFNQMFQYNERISGMGYAATLGWFLAIVTAIITAVQWVVVRRLSGAQSDTKAAKPRRRPGARTHG